MNGIFSFANAESIQFEKSSVKHSKKLFVKFKEIWKKYNLWKEEKLEKFNQLF
jgi:hypothetical protein